ncbi:MAG: putative heavy metal-binding protein, partial [Lachnospiraceae bacterium]
KGGLKMITTTTPSVEGKRITEYKGIVFGEVVSGVNFIKDVAASFSNFFGGRSSSYEEELIEARQNAIREMEQRATAMGANAVVGVDIDYEVLGADNGMLMVTASGTAVIVE